MKPKVSERAKQVSSEIIAFTQNNIKDTGKCIDFALEEITRYFIEFSEYEKIIKELKEEIENLEGEIEAER